MTDTNPDPAEAQQITQALVLKLQPHGEGCVCIACVRWCVEAQKEIQAVLVRYLDKITHLEECITQNVEDAIKAERERETLEGKLAEAEEENVGLHEMVSTLEKDLGVMHKLPAELAERARQVEALREENERLSGIAKFRWGLIEGMDKMAMAETDKLKDQVEALTKRLEATEKVVEVARELGAVTNAHWWAPVGKALPPPSPPESIASTPTSKAAEPKTDERIVAAAIKEGVVFTGPHHHQIIRYMVPMLGIRVVRGEQGFLTSHDRFVGRHEAARIAFAAGQISERQETLFSEQLWTVPDKVFLGQGPEPTPAESQPKEKGLTIHRCPACRVVLDGPQPHEDWCSEARPERAEDLAGHKEPKP